MKNTFFPLGVILVVVAILGILIWKQTTLSTSQDRVYSGEAVVRMKGDGFSPNVLHITTGTRIRFVNEDNVRRWPASDLHPIHTIYPEFDPKEPIEPGKEWTFVFEEVGEWRFHDHLAPYLTGNIIVVEYN